ncbi:hypothetical protein B0H19DRAFT_1240827, partial [Mycena capillaripes]
MALILPNQDFNMPVAQPLATGPWYYVGNKVTQFADAAFEEASRFGVLEDCLVASTFIEGLRYIARSSMFHDVFYLDETGAYKQNEPVWWVIGGYVTKSNSDAVARYQALVLSGVRPWIVAFPEKPEVNEVHGRITRQLAIRT